MGAGRFGAHRPSGRSRDQAAADLISRLGELPPGPEPDDRFKAELRSQLVSITARVVTESAGDSTPGSEPSKARSPNRPGLVRRIRRPLIAVAGSALVLIMLLGLAVWISSSALPGQSLYGVKRASENFQLSLAGDDASKGKAYLDQASRRAKEAARLVGGSTDDPTSHASSLIRSTLATADADTRSGASLLSTVAINQRSASSLTLVSDWARDQASRLADLHARLPAGTARSQSEISIALVRKAADRAAQLARELGCGCLSTSRADELGPLPCTSCGRLGPSTVPVLPVLPTPSRSRSPLPGVSLPSLGGGPSATAS